MLLKGSMTINREYGVPNEVIDSWISGIKWRKDVTEKSDQVAQSIINSVLWIWMIGLLLQLLFDVSMRKNYVLVFFNVLGPITVISITYIKIRYNSDSKSLRKKIEGDWKELSNFVPSLGDVSGMSYSESRSFTIVGLRKHMTDAVVRGDNDKKERILNLLYKARLFFGWINESEIFPFSQISVKGKAAGECIITCNREEYSYELYSVDHFVNVNDIYAFASCSHAGRALLGYAGIVWVSLPNNLRHEAKGIFCFCPVYIDDNGTRRHTIQFKDRDTGGVEEMISVPDGEINPELFKGKILVVFKKLKTNP